MSDSEDSFESADEEANDENKSKKQEKSDKTEEKEKLDKVESKSDESEKHEETNVTEPVIDKEMSKEENKTESVIKNESNTEKESESCENKASTSLENKVENEASISNASAANSTEEPPQTSDKVKTTHESSSKDKPEDHSAKCALDKLTENENKSGWGWSGWGSSWGSSILQTATSSVTTFTSSVGEGFTNVLETVESTLGAPDPEELANDSTKHSSEETQNDNDKQTKEDVKPSESVDPSKGPDTQAISRETENDSHVVVDDSEKDSGWFSTLGVTALTGAVKHTVQQTSTIVQEKGKGLVHGGLDVLENIGKKTFDALAEGDHGLKKTLEKAKEKPNLSLLLREAAVEADEAAKREEEFVESRKSHFGAQFDDFQGLVQLEALEMLSNQCESKLHTLLNAMTTEQVAMVKPELVAIKETFQLGDLEDDETEDHKFIELITEYTGKLALNVTADKLVKVHEKYRQWLEDCITKQKDAETCNISTKDLHEVAIQSIAELTARTVEHFHRLGQLMLINPQGPVTGYKDKSTAIANLTKCVCCEVSIVSTKFTQCLATAGESSEDPDSVNPLITNIYLEAGNSSTYIQDAFQLLLPTVQQAATESTTTT